MSEPTLTVTRADIKRFLARKMGVSTSSSDWSGTEIEDNLDDYIESGERGFYHHDMILPGEQTIHIWSFLNATERIEFTAGQWQYDLPEDFGGGFVDPTIAFHPDDNAGHVVRLVDASEILRQRSLQAFETYDFPEIAAVSTIPSDHTRGQRFSLSVWPTPAATRSGVFRYPINVSALTDSAAYPLGGQPHGETLMASCLACCEEFDDDTMAARHARFQSLLRASIYRDRKLSSPKYFGNLNCPDGMYPPRRHRAEGVTYTPS